MKSLTDIIVAPSGADKEKKLAADFVCGGKNDEVTIERAKTPAWSGIRICFF